MSGNSDTIGEFIKAWSAMDLERIMAFFHADATYTNIPIDPPNQGTEAIRKTIEGFLAMADAVEFVVHGSAENPATGQIMNERTDRFRIAGKWVEIPVMGVFELRDGKIRAWRDYFDMAKFQQSLAG
jgi:limonene-1,2-epoxide hydrolase